MIHDLKTDPIPFNDVRSGRKTCEVRVNDRDYQVGDTLILHEFDRETETYSGRTITRAVTHIQTGYGLPADLVVMSIVTPILEGAALEAHQREMARIYGTRDDDGPGHYQG